MGRVLKFETAVPAQRALKDIARYSGEATLGQGAYAKLRRDLVAGFFKAGSPLRLEALKERYGVGFSPLREALSRLHAERLVVATALRGFRVAALSLDDMRDSIETRVLIDLQALRLSIEHGDDDWESKVVATFHSFSRCAKRLGTLSRQWSDDEVEEMESRIRDFHFALIAQCGSGWLIDFSDQLYTQTERYRRLSVRGSGTRGPLKRDLDGEHRALMEATIERRANEAARLLETLYRKTGESIESYMKTQVAFGEV